MIGKAGHGERGLRQLFRLHHGFDVPRPLAARPPFNSHVAGMKDAAAYAVFSSFQGGGVGEAHKPEFGGGRRAPSLGEPAETRCSRY